MNKTELAYKIRELTDGAFSKNEALDAVDAFTQAVTEALAAGESVQIVGFGTFEAKERAARSAMNPQTKEPMEIPACTVPAFRPGKALKEAVKQQA